MDDDLHCKILDYVSEPKACVACHAWRDHLYDSLKLRFGISFRRQLAKDPVSFSYNAVRPLAEDFEESVSYNFLFSANGTYKMQWARTFDAWSSQSEQQFGKWSVVKEEVLCETMEPDREVTETEVRFAPPGYRFNVAIEDILSSEGRYFQDKLGAPPKPWETTARTGKIDETAVLPKGMWQAVEASPQPGVYYEVTTQAAAPFQPQLRADARFIEIDGEMHEVAGDIVANRPESEWAQLMRCRLRFGING